MPRLCLILVILCLLAFTFLNAQTISKIEIMLNLSVPQDYDYVTTWSDSLLHFYRVDFGSTDYILKHWTCNPQGVYTAPESIFFFQNIEPWGSIPSYLSSAYSRSYGNLYLQFTLNNDLHLLCISETFEIQHNVVVNAGYNLFYLFSPNYLYFTSRADIYSPDIVRRYNVNTNSVDSLFTWPDLAPPVIRNIGTRFLLIYSQSIGSQSIGQAFFIDEQLNIHPAILNLPPFMIDIYIRSQEFSPSAYFAAVNDGLLRTGCFGYITIVDNDITFYGISVIDEMYPYPEAHVISQVIPYGEGRFSCLDSYIWNETLTSFRNYQFNGTDLLNDFNFPVLNSIVNPAQLIRLSSRYGLAISGLSSGPRRFTLIDYQNSALSDTTYYLSFAPYIGAANVYFSHNNIYYVYKTYDARRLYILKIVEYTSNTDPVQPPQILTASAWPNPFSNKTTLKVSLKQPEPLNITIYNLKGQLVRTLSQPGKAELIHELAWDGKADNGNITAPGLYIYQASTPSGKSISGKIILSK